MSKEVWLGLQSASEHERHIILQAYLAGVLDAITGNMAAGEEDQATSLISASFDHARQMILHLCGENAFDLVNQLDEEFSNEMTQRFIDTFNNLIQ